jgi:menaquinone-9 beta-reductase
MSMAFEPWDVVVVGGGPAGSATAARLAASGHRVLLLDRDGFPRRKPCGECVNPGAVRELAALGVLERVEAEPHRRIAGWRIHADDGTAFDGGFPSGVYGIAIGRELLDRALLEHASACGATVRTGVRAGDLLRESGRVVGIRLAERSGGEEIRARLVVGADGLRSIVVRRLGLLRRPPRLRKVALTVHVTGAEPLPERGELYVHREGCVGVVEVTPGIHNVVVTVGISESSRVSAGREPYIDGWMARIPALRGARRISDILSSGPFDWPTRAAIADGALLVGDAAGYYDPFTGQGIFRALRGARLAAAAADDALRRGDTSAAALRTYEGARRAAFAPGERVQRIIEAATSRPRAFGAASLALRACPRAADALIDFVGDLRPSTRP